MKKRMLFVLAMVLCGMAIMTAGCGSEKTSDSTEGVSETMAEGEQTDSEKQDGYPVTVTDSLGNDVTIQEKPETFVSLGPAQTEIVFALGAEDRLTGRSDIDDYPAQVSDIPDIGTYDAPNLEKIIGMAPDLVLSANYMDDDVKSQIEATGAKVYIMKDNGIDETEKAITDIGSMIGCNAEAEDLIKSIETLRKEVTEKCAGAEEVRSVFIDIGDYYSAGPGSLLNSMLSELNCINIAGETDSRWPQLSVEDIIAADPDVYISLYPTVEEIKETPGFDSISAVKNDRVYAFDMMSDDASKIQRSGPRIAEGLEILAKCIYPEVFE